MAEARSVEVARLMSWVCLERMIGRRKSGRKGSEVESRPGDSGARCLRASYELKICCEGKFLSLSLLSRVL